MQTFDIWLSVWHFLPTDNENNGKERFWFVFVMSLCLPVKSYYQIFSQPVLAGTNIYII